MSNDTNTVKMHLGIDKGKVIVRFESPQDLITFDPRNIQEIAMRLVDLAFEADTGLKPVGDTLKADLIQRHREKLTTRLALILNSQRENKVVSNGKLSIQLVDICLTEIFS